MRKLSCLLALFVAVATLTAVTAPPTVEAQEKKDKEKKTEKDDKKVEKVAEPGTIEVYHQAKDGWRFRVKDADGKTIAVGVVGYEKKEEALKQIEILKATMSKAKVTEIKDEKKDKKDKK